MKNRINCANCYDVCGHWFSQLFPCCGKNGKGIDLFCLDVRREGEAAVNKENAVIIYLFTIFFQGTLGEGEKETGLCYL